MFEGVQDSQPAGQFPTAPPPLVDPLEVPDPDPDAEPVVALVDPSSVVPEQPVTESMALETAKQSKAKEIFKYDPPRSLVDEDLRDWADILIIVPCGRTAAARDRRVIKRRKSFAEPLAVPSSTDTIRKRHAASATGATYPAGK